MAESMATTTTNTTAPTIEPLPASIQTKEYISIVGASISQLQHALTTGSITSVELVFKYLQRISVYDCRGPCPLNAIPILNPNVFAEAAASDERRAKGQTLSLLDGIPYTVKDSYKVKGMTVASGSPAFQDLIANEDAFTVQKLKEAGAVLIGKTNMPPMAAGGMQRGVYGRAESPYNTEYLAAAFASGSSNGSAVATAASFAAFGMGEETVSSGRSPASNNALVAYTPSRGAISIRGNWPLYPTCDVVVPHTRTMDDLFVLLDVISAEDSVTRGDFWRDQPFVQLLETWADKPKSFRELSSVSALSLQGLRIAVPEMYVGGTQLPNSVPVHTSPSVIALWERARVDLESLGATVVPVSSFPLIEHYENANSASPTQSPETPHLPKDWNTTERSTLIALAWDDFLRTNADTDIPSLSHVDHNNIYPPYPPDDPQIRYSEPANKIHYDKMASFIESSTPSQSSTTKASSSVTDPTSRSRLFSVPALDLALDALESMRKVHFEDWLTTNHFDLVVFPAAGDVGKADADVNYESAKHAWKNGVKYSNGNRALRHVGVPSVTIPMGIMEDTKMPVGLTFCGRGGADLDLLKRAKAFELGTTRRTEPDLTVELESDRFEVRSAHVQEGRRLTPPRVILEDCSCFPDTLTDEGKIRVGLAGSVIFDQDFASHTATSELPIIEIFVDGSLVPMSDLQVNQPQITQANGTNFAFQCRTTVSAPPSRDERNKVAARRKIVRDSTVVVVLAKAGQDAMPGGCVRLL